MTLEELYRNYTAKDSDACALLAQTHWYSSIADFDPRTHEASPQPLSLLLRKIVEIKESSALKDRLWRIIIHAEQSMTTLFRNLNESPFRDHKILPIRAVRELDTPSFMALARRPGRNIREKLAGKPYLQAVRRYQSVDLPENSLLKAFAERLLELLELRIRYLGDENSRRLLNQIRAWLVTDEAKSIRRWENLPPNNTLLSHKDYRHVYDSWRWLQSLEYDIENDLKRLDERQKTMQKWQEYGKMYSGKQYIFADVPVLFDYDRFMIRTWDDKVRIHKTTGKPLSRPEEIAETDSSVCIDLAELYPRFAFLEGQRVSLPACFPNPFIWQRWENEESSPIPMSLFNADAVYLSEDATTISAPELFFSKNHTLENLNSAARAFVLKLHEKFKKDSLIWLQPDYLNDFELKITRLNINAFFPKAEPLPRSIATVFENVEYSKLRNGYTVVVLDYIDEKQCAIKLEAKYDPELKKAVPETYGFYWERHPAVILPDNKSKEKNRCPYNIYSVDAQGKFYDPESPKGQTNYVSRNMLRQDKRIGNFDQLMNIDLMGSPVQGGVKFYSLQDRAGDIPLWRDQIPELSVKLIANGHYQRFYLVGRGNTNQPIRGRAVNIKIDKSFTLPAGKPYYQFPLYIGESEDEIGFSAKLESPVFPLKSDLVCDLDLTFTYGVDDPYRLVFIPKDKSFPPISVKWESTVEEIVTDAPAPEYPKPMTWDELQRVPKPNNEGTRDLLDWALRSVEQLDQSFYYPQMKRVTGTITDNWHVSQKNGNYYNFVNCEGVDGTVFISQMNFIDKDDYSYYQNNTFSFVLKKDKMGRYFGWRIAPSTYQEPRQFKDFNEDLIDSTITRIHKSLYYPFIQIWRDGRSIEDRQCPTDFKGAMKNIVKYFNSLIQQDEIPQSIKDEILFLLSCLHKDTSQLCVQWIEENVRDLDTFGVNGLQSDNLPSIDHRCAIGLALGNISMPWQNEVFKKLKANLKNHSLRIFAYAIWREQHFVDRFNLTECQAILDFLCKRLAWLQPRYTQQWSISKWELELLLGMLRTRNSSNEEIKMLLQPHQKITKELANQIERVTDIVIKHNIKLSSRIQLGNLLNPRTIIPQTYCMRCAFT